MPGGRIAQEGRPTSVVIDPKDIRDYLTRKGWSVDSDTTKGFDVSLTGVRLSRDGGEIYLERVQPTFTGILDRASYSSLRESTEGVLGVAISDDPAFGEQMIQDLWRPVRELCSVTAP